MSTASLGGTLPARLTEAAVPDRPGLSRRRFAATATVLASGLTLTACSGGAGSAGSATSHSTLRIGQFWPPVSLDPAKAGGESLFYLNPAYDPLIHRAADGSLRPRLATSWRYLGKGNTAFEIKLRAGVTFSDGAPLDAEAVERNIAYFKQAAGQAAAFLAPVAKVEALDEHTVHLALSQPHPQLPALFTQDYFAGNLISPRALADPGGLARRTYGAGPYMLAPAETVAGDHYTYVPNPRYWNAKDRRYDRIVIKVLPNENTALAALKTGQVDVISGSYAIASGAARAGLKVASSPNIVMGIQLNDRAGKLCPPLRDVRVRQALNHAVDRQKITKALLGAYGTPTDQPAVPGQDGHNDTVFYPHDPVKAKQLLAAAGHADGFTLPVVVPSTPAFPGEIAQAIAADLEKVGVRMRITAKDPAGAAQEITKYPASTMGWGALPVYFMGRGLWLRDAVGMNPFHSSDPELERLDRQAAAADEKTRSGLDRDIVRRVVEQAWFLPVCLSPVFLFHRDSVRIEAVRDRPFPSVVDWRPAAGPGA
ncbi:peptide ABC transporter substrate-binding protein [Streptomyces spiralis]|uniref:Peptide ABC transporter substrate-binding protein n=1 Tax=Streptomyces spiralis TaxID=66376 RepID=A0A918ZLZ0_9ACTN|nr:ABC transporter substrate-binding protein [Streptomyces spiralis]GHE59781.1 peptide ABC transporter substrate-binding protein [Streptomyces spiralis]